MENDKIIDMHTHTTYSDGELSPSELIRLAISKNIGVLAITDHNTVEGVKQIDAEDAIIVNSGLTLINGIELDAKVPVGRLHILGYDIDINSPILTKKINEIKDIRLNSVLTIIEQIKRDYGIMFTFEDIRDLVNANHNIGRPDVARLCVKYGYASSIQDAFDKYLIPAHQKTRGIRKHLSYEECLDLIIKSGGVPVLAHPKSLELNEKEFLTLLKELLTLGLKGIEVYHSSHTKEEMDFYLEIANRYDLLISGGSDYHGPTIKPDITLGSGKNENIKIRKLTLLDHLKNRH